MPKTLDKIPDTLGALIVISDLGMIHGRRSAIVKCPHCHNNFIVNVSNASRGKSAKHCGCINLPKKGPYVKKGRAHVIHIRNPNAKYKHPLYWTWKNMIYRCTKPSHPKYNDYGRRGITVCDRWLRSFDMFVKDMGVKPTKLHSLDRRNNDGIYEPFNCRWATMKEQQNNKRKVQRNPIAA